MLNKMLQNAREYVNCSIMKALQQQCIITGIQRVMNSIFKHSYTILYFKVFFFFKCHPFLYSYFFLTEITVNYRHGLPLITLTLPSRKERCQFVVKPMLSTVGSFLQDLQNEDRGVKTAAVLTAGIYIYFFFHLSFFLLLNLCFVSVLDV